MKESTVEAYLVARAKALGGEVRKVRWLGRRGAPDRLLMLPGKKRVYRGKDKVPGGEGPTQQAHPGGTIWVELKAPGKKPEAHQIREHERMRKMAQRVEVIDSKEGVDKLLENFK